MIDPYRRVTLGRDGANALSHKASCRFRGRLRRVHWEGADAMQKSAQRQIPPREIANAKIHLIANSPINALHLTTPISLGLLYLRAMAE